MLKPFMMVRCFEQALESTCKLMMSRAIELKSGNGTSRQVLFNRLKAMSKSADLCKSGLIIALMHCNSWAFTKLFCCILAYNLGTSAELSQQIGINSRRADLSYLGSVL